MHSVTIVCGDPGAGKSTYARGLAQQQNAALLDLDTVSERLVRVGLTASGLDPDDRDSSRYKQMYREVIHDTLFAIAQENLPHVPVVIVAPFTKERLQASWLDQLSAQLGTRVHVVCVYCAPSERRQRIEARKNPRDQAKLAAWSEFSKAEEGPRRPTFDHEWVDTTSQR